MMAWNYSDDLGWVKLKALIILPDLDGDCNNTNKLMPTLQTDEDEIFGGEG